MQGLRKWILLSIVMPWLRPRQCARMNLTPPLPHARICTHFDDPPSPHACVRTIRMPPKWMLPKSYGPQSFYTFDRYYKALQLLLLELFAY